MKSSLLSLSALGALLASCATVQPDFVILRDVPEHPSVVVIPADATRSQVHYANRIEAALVRGGLSVLAAPAVKAVVTESKLGASGTEAAVAAVGSRTAEARVTETYYAYNQLTADYVILADGDASLVKIQKRQTGEILSIFNLAYPPQYSRLFDQKLHGALAALGISIRSEPSEK